MRYEVIIEAGSDGSFSAYVPELPGCVSCGETIEEVRLLMDEAIELHIDSLQQHGEPVPLPQGRDGYVVARNERK